MSVSCLSRQLGWAVLQQWHMLRCVLLFLLPVCIHLLYTHSASRRCSETGADRPVVKSVHHRSECQTDGCYSPRTHRHLRTALPSHRKLAISKSDDFRNG